MSGVLKNMPDHERYEDACLTRRFFNQLENRVKEERGAEDLGVARTQPKTLFRSSFEAYEGWRRQNVEFEHRRPARRLSVWAGYRVPGERLYYRGRSYTEYEYEEEKEPEMRRAYSEERRVEPKQLYTYL